MSVTGKSTAGPEDAELKLPLTFSTKEWSAFRSPSVRIGGFGPWFSGGLLVAILALLGGARGLAAATDRAATRRPPRHGPSSASAGICLVATIVQPSAFLARFAPAALVRRAGSSRSASCCSSVPGSSRPIAWVALGILLVDAVGVAVATVVWDKRDSDREAASLATLRRLSPLEANFSSWRLSEARRFARAGIRFRTVDKVACKVPYILSVAGGLTRHPQLYGVPPPPGGVQLCPLTPAPPPTG